MSDFPYPGKFTFVDVEIPNLNNDCICAISIIVIDEGKEIVRTTELINPETFFSANNIKIHHIHRKDVLSARTLKEFWHDYGRYFEEPYIIGAHNAMSDISVINKDLARFNTEIKARRYIDTMDITEQFYYKGTQQKGDLKLCNIADRLGIELDHHNPQSDVNACCEIVKYMHHYFAMDLQPFIKPIKPTRLRPPKNPAIPSARQMRIFLDYVQKQIIDKTPLAEISLFRAKKRGDQAYSKGDYEGVILNYELAAQKNWQGVDVYLRLAEIYDSLNMSYDAHRILEKGIRTLKKKGKDWKILKAVQTRIASARHRSNTQTRTRHSALETDRQKAKKHQENLPDQTEGTQAIKKRAVDHSSCQNQKNTRITNGSLAEQESLKAQVRHRKARQHSSRRRRQMAHSESIKKQPD